MVALGSPPTGKGVRGGGDGTLGGVWLWEGTADGAVTQRGTTPESFRTAIRVAGRMDPATGLPSLDGEYQWFGREREWKTAAGAVWRYMTNGGGGWGNPLERDLDAIAWDVRQGYVSRGAAERDYGVVFGADGAIDRAATARQRASLQATTN